MHSQLMENVLPVRGARPLRMRPGKRKPDARGLREERCGRNKAKPADAGRGRAPRGGPGEGVSGPSLSLCRTRLCETWGSEQEPRVFRG